MSANHYTANSAASVQVAGDVISLYRLASSEGLKKKIVHFNSLARMNQYRKVYDVSVRYLSPAKKALDWGCGNGHFSYFLLHHGVRTTGFSFDPAPDYMLSQPGYDHVQGRTDNPISLPLSSASFDLVFSIGVLEHVRDTGGSESASLSEMWRVLKPGGHFLCFHFPNRYGWIEPLADALGIAWHFHKHKYTREQIKRMSAQAHFELVEWGRYNFLPRNVLGRLPTAVCDTRAGSAALNSIDTALATCLPLFTQNHYFVCQKPAPQR
jgi:SAM-dependent methyltransferase